MSTTATPKPDFRPIARRAALDATANVGVTETGGNNRGKFVAIYLKAVGIFEAAPWCAAFLCVPPASICPHVGLDPA